MRLFAILAELALVTHLAWIAWILFGWIVTRHRLWLRWVQIASVLWGMAVEAGSWSCPLTLLEQWLEARAGVNSYLSPYQGSFIIHYLEAFIYPDVPQALLTWFGPVVCSVILAIHGTWFWRDRRSKQS